MAEKTSHKIKVFGATILKTGDAATMWNPALLSLASMPLHTTAPTVVTGDAASGTPPARAAAERRPLHLGSARTLGASLRVHGSARLPIAQKETPATPRGGGAEQGATAAGTQNTTDAPSSRKGYTPFRATPPSHSSGGGGGGGGGSGRSDSLDGSVAMGAALVSVALVACTVIHFLS